MVGKTARLVEANVRVSCLRLLLASNLRAAFVSVSVLQFARILALDHYVSFSDLSHCDYWPFSSTFSAAGGATELLRGWKVAPKIALFAI